MHNIVFFLAVSLLFAGCSWIPIGVSDLSPLCQGAACHKVATSGDPWLSNRSAPANQYIALGSVAMRMPPDFEIQSKNNTHLLLWPDKSALRIKHVTIDNWEFPALPNPFYQSHYHIIDYPRLMFLHTASESEPELIADRYIWRMAMDNKGTYLRNSRHFYHSTQGSLQLYFAAVRMLQLQYLVFVTDESRPDQLVELLFYQISFNRFLDILASLHPT